MKFHIRLDSDNIFNFNSYFVSGIIAIKNTSERKTYGSLILQTRVELYIE